MEHAIRPAELLGGLMKSCGWTVAVAESLTCGAIAAELGKAPDAAAWFSGGVVAYAPRTKFDVLRVPPGPVVSPTAASAMAETVAGLFAADLAIAVTGVGGPGPESGNAAGTVWFAVHSAGATRTFLRRFSGAPQAVLDQTVIEAVRQLVLTARSLGRGRTGEGARTDGVAGADLRPASAPVPGDVPITPSWTTHPTD